MKKHLFLTILSVGTMLSSCENSIEKINLVTTYEKLPAESTSKVEMFYSDSAKIKMKLSAPRLDRYVDKDEPYVEFLEGVKVVFYSGNLEPESQITCNYAIHYQETGRMEARNDVVVVNKKGEKLNTEHLVWDEKREKIFTEEFVKITTVDEIIYGDGLEANQDFTQYKIKNIKGTIKIKEGEPDEKIS